MTEAEAALCEALLETLTCHPRHMHDCAEARADIAWEYVKVADRAHPMVAEVLREAATWIVE